MTGNWVIVKKKIISFMKVRRALWHRKKQVWGSLPWGGVSLVFWATGKSQAVTKWEGGWAEWDGLERQVGTRLCRVCQARLQNIYNFLFLYFYFIFLYFIYIFILYLYVYYIHTYIHTYITLSWRLTNSGDLRNVTSYIIISYSSP